MKLSRFVGEVTTKVIDSRPSDDRLRSAGAGCVRCGATTGAFYQHMKRLKYYSADGSKKRIRQERLIRGKYLKTGIVMACHKRSDPVLMQ